jgi:hypothetical protein
MQLTVSASEPESEPGPMLAHRDRGRTGLEPHDKGARVSQHGGISSSREEGIRMSCTLGAVAATAGLPVRRNCGGMISRAISGSA